MQTTNKLRVGVDIGGTFTDLVAIDDELGRMLIAKTPSVPGDYARGVTNALDDVIDDYSQIELFINGTTAPLNAFLERKGARTAIVTTKGFGDAYVIRRSNRMRMYDLHYEHATPIVPRSLTFEVEERLNARGETVTPLNERQLEEILVQLRENQVESVAICFLHSYKNDTHERRVAEFFRREAPELFVSPSYEICREWREYERLSTTVINAYISPILQRYLQQLSARIDIEGFDKKAFVMQSNGGLISLKDSESRGLLTLMSGPVGACVGSALLSEQLDEKNLICIDMGGTSFEVSLVVDGNESVVLETEFEGFPIRAPMVDIHSIGAGGGSIAWNENGALHVGPQSAAAVPGPACYGRGGRQPTVTDANVVLGRVDPGCFLGGRMQLDEQAAQEAVGGLASDFDMTMNDMAEGILNVINSKMANAIRTMTIRKGIDPRDFCLVAFGGAGPMHAALIAEELEIDKIIVPNVAGEFSAFGMLHADVRHDMSTSVNERLAHADWGAVRSGFEAMESELTALMRSEGVESANMQFIRYLELRYVRQEYTVSVQVPDDVELESSSSPLFKSLFDALYLKTFGHSNPDEAGELANIRVEARGLNKNAKSNPVTLVDNEIKEPAETRSVVFSGERVDTQFIDRAHLKPDEVLHGPAIVNELSCTTVVPPGYSAKLDDAGNIVISRLGDLT